MNITPQSPSTVMSAKGDVAAGLLAVAPPSPLAQPRILRLPEVMEKVGLKRSAIYLFITEGHFPKQVSLGTRAVGWLEYEVDAWVATRIELTRRYHESRSKPR